jgi:hypothetical protein
VTDTPETPRLYRFKTMPGDRGHLPAEYFSSGLVRALPSEIDDLVAGIAAAGHDDLVSVEPADTDARSIDDLRIAVGSALNIHHAEVRGDDPCAADAPFIAAFEKDIYG